jgi:hypothetical protein
METSYKNNQMSLDNAELTVVISKNLRRSSYIISVKSEHNKNMLFHGVLAIFNGKIIDYKL